MQPRTGACGYADGHVTTKRTILVVEDDAAIRRGIVDTLQFAGFLVIACADGADGMTTALSAQLDLVVLDVMLPKTDGLQILAEVRRVRPSLPVILVTARGAEQDRVHGLQTGADDYVVKPFSSKELLARVVAVLRRSAERPSDVGRVAIAGRVIDFDRREIERPDQTRALLSEKEADLLRYLVQNRGRAIARTELLERVWGLPAGGDSATRAIDMHIVNLRDKLADPSDCPEVVITVRGKGYMLAGGTS